MIRSLQMLAGTLILTTLVACSGGAPASTTGTAPGSSSAVKAEVTSIKTIAKGAGSVLEFTFKNTGTKVLGSVGATVTFMMGSKQVDQGVAVALLSASLSAGESKSADTSSIPDASKYDCYQYKLDAFASDNSDVYTYTSAPICR